MKVSIGLPEAASEPHVVPPHRFRRFAKRAESYGFDGAWQSEHLVKPPTYDSSFFDPLSSLSFVAGATESIPTGTCILNIPLRNPVLFTKRILTMQYLSEGQLTLGLGTGYTPAEFEATNVPFEKRSPLYLEYVELVRKPLTEENVTYDGEFHSVEDVTLEPRVSTPPRLLTGGHGVDTDEGRIVVDTVKERLLYTDGWLAGPRPPSLVEEDWSQFASYVKEHGRDPSELDKVVMQYCHVVPNTGSDEAFRIQKEVYTKMPDRPLEFVKQNWLTGSVADQLQILDQYRDQGYDEVILHPLATDPGELDRQLRLFDEYLRSVYV